MADPPESSEIVASRIHETDRVEIRVGPYRLIGRLESQLAPVSCRFFRTMLPLHNSLIHCRWSGESTWVPFDTPLVPLPFENHTRYPHPGQVLIYAHNFSEPEILLPYGACAFNSRVGPLAGNHFMTLEAGAEHLPALGREILWGGAQRISIDLVSGV